MAAFSDKGDVCSEPLCGMRDFLPFSCNKCSKVFCVDHYAPDKHNCSRILAGDRRVYVCPACLEAVPMRNEEAEEAAARRHQPQCQPDKYEERRRQLKGNTCPIKGCRERLTDITTYQCKLCSQAVCLKHRLQEDHDCQRVQQARKEKQQRGRGFRLFGSSSSSVASKPASPGARKEPTRSSSKQQVCQMISSPLAVRHLPQSTHALQQTVGGTAHVGYEHRGQVIPVSSEQAQAGVSCHGAPPRVASSLVLNRSDVRSSSGVEVATRCMPRDSRTCIPGTTSLPRSSSRIFTYRAVPNTGVYPGGSSTNSVACVHTTLCRVRQRTLPDCLPSRPSTNPCAGAAGPRAFLQQSHPSTPSRCLPAGGRRLTPAVAPRGDGAARGASGYRCLERVTDALPCTRFCSLSPCSSAVSEDCGNRGVLRPADIVSDQATAVMGPSVQYCSCPLAVQRSTSKSKSRCVVS